MLQGRAVAQQGDTPNSINAPSGLVYLHGDHLGSVSVVTDTVRRVLARQDYTPWGEARGGDITQTTLDFTGQRKDGTGLLYYGARYYDPQTGRFTSPDSVAPGKGNPQARNRYSYVLNNPLKFVDPTGHCFANAQNNEERAENGQCNKYISWLKGWGIDVDPANYANWESSQLEAGWQGALRMSNTLGWLTDGRLFQENVLRGGRLTVDKVQTRNAGTCSEPSVFACTEPDGGRITFSVLAFTGDNEDQWAFNQATVVHELAHVWDFRQNRALSNGLNVLLANAPDGQRDRGGWVRPLKDNEPLRPVHEDFADSVEAVVMSGTRAGPQDSFHGSIRENYVSCTAAPQRCEYFPSH